MAQLDCQVCKRVSERDLQVSNRKVLIQDRVVSLKVLKCRCV